MSNRKLASIQKIKELSSIEGKDKIVLATLNNGWKVIVQKETYNIDDYVVYFEIDSVLPDIPLFEFLKKRSKNMRIRTMKMCGVISQGLCTTLHEGKQVAEQLNTKFPFKINVGLDLTDILKVTKYEEDETNRVTSSKQKYNKFEKVSMEYLPEELTLFSPCPICGQNEHRIQWSNVSETGTYIHYNSEFTCKPFMQHECEYCGSQIHFDTNLPKDELVEWITQSCEIINTWKGKS